MDRDGRGNNGVVAGSGLGDGNGDVNGIVLRIFIERDFGAVEGERKGHFVGCGRGRRDDGDAEIDHAVGFARLIGHGNARNGVVGENGDVEGGGQTPSVRQSVGRCHYDADGLVALENIVRRSGEGDRVGGRIRRECEPLFRQARVRAGNGEVDRDAPFRQRGSAVRRYRERGRAFLLDRGLIGSDADGIIVDGDDDGVRRRRSNADASGQGVIGIGRKRYADALFQLGAIVVVGGNGETDHAVAPGRNGKDAAGAAAGLNLLLISRAGDGNILPVRFGYGQRDFYFFGVWRRNLDDKRSARSLDERRNDGAFERNCVSRNGEVETSLLFVNPPAVRPAPGENKQHLHAFVVFGNIAGGRCKGDGDLLCAAGDVDDIGAGSQEGSAARITRCNRLPDTDSLGGIGTREDQLDRRGNGRSMFDGDGDIKFPAFLKPGGVRRTLLQTEEIVVGGNGDGVPGVLADGPTVRKSVFGLRVKHVQDEMNLRVKFGSAVLGDVDGEVDHACIRRCNWKSDGGIGCTMAKKRLSFVENVGFIVQRALKVDSEVNAVGRHITDNRELHGVLPALLHARGRDYEADAIGPGHPRIGDGDLAAGDGIGQRPSVRQ